MSGVTRQIFAIRRFNGQFQEYLPPYPVVQYLDKSHVRVLGAINYFVGTGQVFVPADIDVDVAAALDTGSIAAGTDYYVFLTAAGGVAVSTSDTPAGLATGTYRKLGGFHTICRSVPADYQMPPSTVYGGALHPLAGWSAGDILPLSVWAANHHPRCQDPRGMVYIEELDLWVDIYVCSGNISAPVSRFGGTRLHTQPQTAFLTGLANVGKTLLDDAEFWFAAVGSNTNTKVAGSEQPDPDTTGGHVDTEGDPMISAVGCEECCGLSGQWLRDNFLVSKDAGSWDNGSTYATKAFDGGSNSFGSIWFMQFNRAVFAGGTWSTTSVPSLGPLYRYAGNSRSSARVFIGGRGSSRGSTMPVA